MVKVETKPVWNSSSFLTYAGGLTVLTGAFLALTYLSTQFNGAGEGTAWTLLIFVILTAIAHAFRHADRWLTAGIFAFSSVIVWIFLVVLTLDWWGWENGSFRDVRIWSWPRLLLEVLVLLVATGTRWRFKFPFIRAISAPVGALFVIDLVTKWHGNFMAVVALLVGLAYLLVGRVSDKPSTFWLHLTAGYLVGIPIVYWCHKSTFDFAVIAFMSLVYVVWAYGTKRSTWAVYGTIGFFAVASYFVFKAVEDTIRSAMFGGGSIISDLWFIPLSIGLLGFWLVALGMAGKRKKKDDKRTPVTEETKPVWNTSSFLVYTGGLTVLLGAAVGLGYLATQYHGYGALSGWTLLFLAIIYGLAHALRFRGRWLAAGIFAFISVFVWATLVLLTMLWIGWHPFRGSPVPVGLSGFASSPFGVTSYGSPFATWSWSRMLFWILVLAAAWFDRRVFRFPFIRLISAVVFWLFVSDLLTSFHGNWFAVVTLLTGLAYLAVGKLLDKPSAFWLHLVGGLLIGGVVVHWFRTSDGDFAVISIVALVYVATAYWTKRSSWAVLGTIGFFAATSHYVGSSPSPTSLLTGASQMCSGSIGTPITCAPVGSVAPWAPALAYGLLGFWLVALGLAGMRETRPAHAQHAVVVETTTVVVETSAPPAAEEPPPAEEPPAG